MAGGEGGQGGRAAAGLVAHTGASLPSRKPCAALLLDS